MKRRCSGWGFPAGAAFLSAALLIRAHADTVVLTPVADTTLIEEEVARDHNAGGMPFVNAGTTQNFTTNRALFRFDLAGAVLPGSSVQQAEFIVEVVGKPKDGFAAAPFGLHRVLRPWGEGDKVADPTHPGQGAAATLGEATWNDRFAFTTNAWAVPGGAPDVDFVAALSAEATVYGLEDSPYTFISSPVLIGDVQAWADHPDDNFGWILICQTESVDFTARRFGSREDTDRPPLLRIDFVPPLRIDRAGVVAGSFVLEFIARAGQSYAVESRDRVAGTVPWLELTNVPAPLTLTSVTVTDALWPGQRFYRLRSP
jgi:hypothetical protein